MKSDFLYWYSLALALIAVGLSVGFLEKAVGSPIGWGGGFAQYLGGIYFLIAVSTVIRGAPTKGIPLEKKDRDLVEIMNVVAYTVDKDGVTTYVSPAIELLIGYSPSEVMGRSFTEFIYQEDLQRSMQSFQRVLSGYTEKNEYRILTKSGEIRWVHTSSRPLLRRNRVVGVQGELTDITERKKTEEALVEERDLFQALIDNIPDAIYFKDDKNRFIRVNKAKAEFSGTSPANMIGKTDFDFFPQEQAKESIADDNRVMESNRPLVDKVEKITHADGTEHWVSVTKIPRYNGKGQVIGTMGISRNITERKKVGEQIKHEAEEWNRTFDAIPDFVFILDRVFRFVRVNKSLTDALKVKPEDLIGKTCFEILHKPNKIWPQCPFLEVLKDGRTHTVEVENLNICPSLLVTASPIFDKKGELVGVVHIAKDITERKKIEAALIQSEKLKALGEMAAGVAHDFNNLLAIILGNAQLLERRAERYRLEEIKERLRIIARTAHKGGETVRRLQDFTRKEAPRRDFVKINLNDIVKEAIAATSPRWKDEAEGKGITIRIREELGKLPFIWGSISELKEVLTNLIFNALEAMPQGGEIAIRTEARENEVLLYLTDTGQGIPDSIKEKIFDPFFTTKGPKASGLGLSVCFGVIKRHQGEIKVESTEGKGTTFTISIPVCLQAPSEKERLQD
ncbi:MAG: PAS domain S-box protein, partial [bacterium]